MIWFSWDKRIRRAEQLAVEYPASAEILRFYSQIARFQEKVYDRLKQEAASPFQPECLEPDLPHLVQLIQRIGNTALTEAASEIETQHWSVREILAMDEAPYARFFARVLLQPYMEHAANPNGAVPNHREAQCPACGEWPQTAVLRGEGDGAKRWLVCSLCSREWEFRRVVCPCCGEEDKDRLPVYTASPFEHVRVEACDRCHTYIKSVDLTKNGLAIPCVDEIASVPLDLWAEEAGYQKLQRNILLL